MILKLLDIEKKLVQLPIITISVIFLFILLLLSLAFGLIFDLTGQKAAIASSIKISDIESAIYQFIVSIIVAPIIETFLFQLLPFVLLKKYSNAHKNRWITIIIGGIIFGLLHPYSIFNIITASVSGMLLMYLFILRTSISERNAFETVLLTHLLRNLISFMGQLYLVFRIS